MSSVTEQAAEVRMNSDITTKVKLIHPPFSVVLQITKRRVLTQKGYEIS
jgi:hypothetical protein